VMRLSILMIVICYRQIYLLTSILEVCDGVVDDGKSGTAKDSRSAKRI